MEAAVGENKGAALNLLREPHAPLPVPLDLPSLLIYVCISFSYTFVYYFCLFSFLLWRYFLAFLLVFALLFRSFEELLEGHFTSFLLAFFGGMLFGNVFFAGVIFFFPFCLFLWISLYGHDHGFFRIRILNISLFWFFWSVFLGGCLFYELSFWSCFTCSFYVAYLRCLIFLWKEQGCFKGFCFLSTLFVPFRAGAFAPGLPELPDHMPQAVTKTAPRTRQERKYLKSPSPTGSPKEPPLFSCVFSWCFPAFHV